MDHTEVTVALVGKIIRAVRDSRGYTRDFLAQLAGVSVWTISDIEQGGSPSLPTLRRIAAALKVDVGQLLDPSTLDKFKPPAEYVTIREAAMQLTYSQSRLETAADSGRIPQIHWGQRRLIYLPATREFIAKQRSPYPRTFSAQEAAERLGVGVTAVYRRIQDGALTATKRDGHWLINAQSVEQLAGQLGRYRSPASLTRDWEDPASTPRAAGGSAHHKTMTLGRRISELQRRAHLSDSELSREAGVPLNVLNWVKRGHGDPTAVIEKIARALGVEVSSLAGRSIKTTKKGIRKTKPRP